MSSVSRCACGSDRSAPTLAGLARCRACGLVYTPAPPDADYGTDYFEAGGYRSYFTLAGQWRYEAARRIRWAVETGRPGRLVEAGSAGGFFLEAVLREGIDAQGVEPSPAGARYARDELGIDVVQDLFEEAELDGPVDAVCAFHVLEHVPDPGRFLAKAHALLRSGGRLALEVPNIESASAAQAGANWSALMPEYHRWHFSPSTLVRLVTAAGFELERCDTVFARFYTRPRQLLGRFALENLATGWRATGSLRTVHALLGDHVRLLAKRP